MYNTRNPKVAKYKPHKKTWVTVNEMCLLFDATEVNINRFLKSNKYTRYPGYKKEVVYYLDVNETNEKFKNWEWSVKKLKE